MPVVWRPTAPHIVFMIREKADPLALFADWFEEDIKSLSAFYRMLGSPYFG